MPSDVFVLRAFLYRKLTAAPHVVGARPGSIVPISWSRRSSS